MSNIKKIVQIYLIGILLFTLFRLLLFISALDKLGESYEFSNIVLSFLMGLRFDTVISGYLLILPYVILTLNHFYSKFNRQISIFVFVIIFIGYLLAFLVCAADIPYFHQFYSRFSIDAFKWIDTPDIVFNMIIQEPTYWLYSIPLIIITVIFYLGLKRILLTETTPKRSRKFVLEITASVLFFLLILLGIRGRTAIKSPIRVGTAYFCSNPLLNKLGLNPNFSLIRSYLDSKNDANKPIDLMDNQIALRNVREYLKIDNDDTVNVISRLENQDSQNKIGQRPNIVIIMMESMSAAKMSRHGFPLVQTPFLDSISNHGYYFENAYSAGIHTYNGVFSTLFSFPALYKQHAMKKSPIPEYNGISGALRKLGYSTVFFTTHDGQFDNVEGFLMANEFERVIAQSDYPANEVKTALGVPDDYLFRYSIPILNDLNKKNKPFFAAFMTASDHGPYYIPEYFKPKNAKLENQIVEYADYSLRVFIESARKEKWFDNTLFVFIADHGYPKDADYDVSMSYNHVPLLFYSPKLIVQPKVFSEMAGQIDVYPSIMGLLELPFENNTLGINLFKEKRPYIYFNVDDKYAVLDNEWLMIVKKDGTKGLYKYREKDQNNYLVENKELGERMRIYAESNIQTYQYLLSNNKTKIKK
ncbi:MAG: sulfatase-like hydrolase/transferase [Ignavibacteriae bacterium]|nr:sulfatase-like hydrolase/transferase [Ignavibacteriota bacterium]MCB9220506.1 sulfatase-like hydrolase/transferase [Ignavibacteria bacterium]